MVQSEAEVKLVLAPEMWVIGHELSTRSAGNASHVSGWLATQGCALLTYLTSRFYSHLDRFLLQNSIPFHIR